MTTYMDPELGVFLRKREIAKPLTERMNIKELCPNEEATKTLRTAIEKAISSGEYENL